VTGVVDEQAILKVRSLCSEMKCGTPIWIIEEINEGVVTDNYIEVSSFAPFRLLLQRLFG
jgi:hypothetical protein